MAPKEVGGLGGGSIRDLNIALLSKWKWKFKAKPNSLWVEVIKAIHRQPRKHMQFPCNKAFAGPWRQITSVEAELRSENIGLNEFMKGKVGLGNSILFWFDWWIGSGPLKEVYSDLFMLEKKQIVQSGRKM